MSYSATVSPRMFPSDRYKLLIHQSLSTMLYILKCVKDHKTKITKEKDQKNGRGLVKTGEPGASPFTSLMGLVSVVFSLYHDWSAIEYC